MNIPCEVIKDLLPLYHDGVCSEKSKTIIEQHIAGCDICKGELAEMEERLPINCTAKQNLRSAEAVNSLSKKWRKGMTKSMLKGIGIAILIVVIVFLVLYSFLDIRVIPKPF